ncbi:MAG: single-stranded-DNA-specific exonuclease RecJ, partial [Clostridia bacterium]|nr:single-stranded-DNA-specific exonuclease RecJ [Clostridia bacterium]
MRKIVREFEFTPEERENVNRLSAGLGVSETTAGILYARGNDTVEKAYEFLHPSRKHFLSPFLMSGMKEAAELITRARDEEWRVAVFGDYDADGIGASAIAYRALVRFGIVPYLYVPERAEGYGMSIEAIDKIFDEFMPDLFITVDCGISNRKEVEYIREQGAYAIVTDHHELPGELPDCITINPKLKDDYPYDNLCGAGVAFKLACALIGDEAMELLDFAALSTVADSVPLLGENRDIVAEGLKLMQENCRPALAALLGKANEISAQTLAFTVAPRINAAGRMGDAQAALSMFISDDEREIGEIAARLNHYNSARQKYCDELYARALEEVYAEGAYRNVVMLAGENWNTGMVGIVAARIAEQFSRPALLFVKNGDMLRGSARSIENVNIFEALKACSEYIEEFGGHSQAAGVNVKAENFEKLKCALDAYLGEHYTRDDFAPVVFVSGEGKDFRRVSRELNMLEPFGVGNRRPQFVIEADGTDAALAKALSPHVTLSLNRLDMLSFNGSKNLKILRSDLHKSVVFDYNLSCFRGREFLKGFVRSVVYDGASGTDVELDLFENRLLAAACPSVSAEKLTEEELNRFLSERIAQCAYGLCAVCYDRSSFARYPALREISPEVFCLASGSLENAVLVAPEPGTDLSAFRDIVFLDSPAAGVRTGNAHVCIAAHTDAEWGVDPARESLLGVFTAIKAFEGSAVGESIADAARAMSGTSVPLRQ